MIESEFENLNLARMQKFADALSKHLKQGDCLLLNGDLGAGKTQFSKFLIQALVKDKIDVPSPTFTIVQTYDSDDLEIWHFDLYRIGDVDELEEIGWFEDIKNRLSLVEWPDRLGTYAPKNALEVSISIQENDLRCVRLSTSDQKWDQHVKDIKNNMIKDAA